MLMKYVLVISAIIFSLASCSSEDISGTYTGQYRHYGYNPTEGEWFSEERETSLKVNHNGRSCFIDGDFINGQKFKYRHGKYTFDTDSKGGHFPTLRLEGDSIFWNHAPGLAPRFFEFKGVKVE